MGSQAQRLGQNVTPTDGPLTLRKALGPCLISAVLCGVLLATVLRLDQADLSIPINYIGDAVIFLLKAKGIEQGEWIFHNSRVGMPFGADFRDFPLNLSWDSTILLAISLLTTNAGLILNLYWLGAVLSSAVTSTYCFQRLGAGGKTCVFLGVVFALQPYGFYRGISHLHSLYYLVPLLATGAIELALSRFEVDPRERGWPLQALRRLPPYLWLGVVAAGFSYAYTAFFASFVLAVATLLAFIRRFRFRDALVGLVAITVLCAAVVCDLSPTLAHWAKNGKSNAMDFKYPAEAEIYGLKIRFLLTPTPQHPLPPFRFAEERLKAASFPFDTENESARLGTVGSIGFLALLGFALLATGTKRTERTEHEEILGISAALCLACIVLATVGGFGDFFNTFVAPDIRCYNRISPFISFFSLVAVGYLLNHLQGWRFVRAAPPWLSTAFLAVAAAVAARDQAFTSGYLPHSARQDLYRHDAAFVHEIESKMPRDSMIFQLPHAEFPVERLRGRMFNNDQGRPYVHSERLRWSWGAVSGTTPAEWNRMAAGLPMSEMVHRLHHREFAGIWVDLFGYDVGSTPEIELTRMLGVTPLRSANGRYLFWLFWLCSGQPPEAGRLAGWTIASCTDRFWG